MRVGIYLPAADTILNCVTLFLALFTTFKLFHNHPKLSVITATIGGAFSDLGYFFVVYVVVNATYMFIGSILFGASLEEFSTLLDSWNTLFLTQIGGYAYENLALAFDGDEDFGLLAVAFFFYYTCKLPHPPASIPLPTPFPCPQCHLFKADRTRSQAPSSGADMLITYFLLINILLGILIDSFVNVQTANKERHKRIDVNTGGSISNFKDMLMEMARDWWFICRVSLSYMSFGLVPRPDPVLEFWSDEKWLATINQIVALKRENKRALRTGTMCSLLATMQRLPSCKQHDIFLQAKHRFFSGETVGGFGKVWPRAFDESGALPHHPSLALCLSPHGRHQGGGCSFASFAA